MPNWRSAMQLVRTVAENYRLPYFTLSPVYSICEEHGYLEGEQKSCPYCKKPTEVYSRITGYYRAVSNWNNGKASEFKERKSYNIGNSFDTHNKEIDMTLDDSYNAETKAVKMDSSQLPTRKEDQIQSETEYLLFKTHTCPNCQMLEDMNILTRYPVQEIYADDEKNKTLVKQYRICSAPTLIVKTDNDVKSYTGVSGITRFVKADH